VLKSSTRIEDEGITWWPACENVQVAFRKAAQEVWPDWARALRDPRSQAFLKKFFISFTEEEFSRGLLRQKAETQQQKTLVFRRTFSDPDQHTSDQDLKKFIDVLPTHGGGGLDEEAQQLLRDQLDMVPPHVKQIEYLALQWAPGGIDPTETEYREYLCNFLDDFTRQTMASLREAAQKRAVTPDELVDEVSRHLTFALERADKFTSTTSTAKVEAAALEYLSTFGAEGVGPSCTSALVVFGRSGAGKTYLLSKVMERSLSRSQAGGVTVIRFLGTTPLSSNVHALLTSICEQLRRAYRKTDTVPSDFKALRDYFHTAITVRPTDDAPLKFFIDSLDQLDDSNGGRRLDWLPTTGLPPHVRVVVSTLPDYPGEFQCVSILQTRLDASHHQRQMVKVETISESERVLEHLLRLLGRTLTKTQHEHVLEAFAERTDTDAEGTPLWLTIVAQAVAHWASFEGIRFAIKPAVRDLIIDLFERLENSQGRPLVRAVLACITIAKGVSETELNHLAALDDEVLADVYEWWVPVRMVPPLLVTRLLTELAPYLTRRGDGSGAVLVSWYHRQFWEAAQAWLFGTGADGDATKRQRHATKRQRHHQLADYLSGFWAGVAKPYIEELKTCIQRPQSFPGEAAADRQVLRQPLVLKGDLLDPSASSKFKLNVRRIRELVTNLIGIGQIDRLVQELTSPLYIAAKVALRQVPELLREYAEAPVFLRQSEAGHHAAAAAAELAKCRATMGRFLKHLEQQPRLFALQMCFQEPDQHPLFIEAGRLLQELQLQGAALRVVHWMGKPQHFDPCQLEIKEHKGPVKAVCFFRGAGTTGDCIASASDDGTIKIKSAVSGDVVLELQAHDCREVYCLDVHTDGTRMASGGGDGTVRL
jgi:NACHT domain- and WD repeat-containing protein